MPPARERIRIRSRTEERCGVGWRVAFRTDGQPGVLLTLADDRGELGGTVVLNMVSREGGQPHVIASEPHLMANPTMAGNALTFTVTRTRDGRKQDFTMSLTEDGKAQLHCLNCGADAPVVELQKEQYR